MAQVTLENTTFDHFAFDSFESLPSDPRIKEFSRLCREKIASANTPNEERAFAIAALNHVRVMHTRGEPIASIRRYVNESFHLLGNAVKSLNDTSVALQQGKAALNQLCTLFPRDNDSAYDPFLAIPPMSLIPPPRNYIERINSGSINEITPPNFKPVLENPYQDEMVSDVKDALGSIRFFGAGLELLGKAVTGTVKAVCKTPLPADPAFLDCLPFSPLPAQNTVSGEKFCKDMRNFATDAVKAGLEAVDLKEPVKQAVDYWNSFNGSSTTKALVAHGIPEEEASELATHYVSDLKSIAAFSVTSAGISVVKKGISCIPAGQTTVKEVRIKGSTSTYSTLDSAGRPVVIRETHKTFYQPPQDFNKFPVDPVPIEMAASQANSKFLTSPKNTCTPFLHKKMSLPLPVNSKIKPVDFNKIILEGKSESSFHLNSNVPCVSKIPANSNVAQGISLPIKMVAYGPSLSSNFECKMAFEPKPNLKNVTSEVFGRQEFASGNGNANQVTSNPGSVSAPAIQTNVSLKLPYIKENLYYALKVANFATMTRRDIGQIGDHIDLSKIFEDGIIREYFNSERFSPIEEFVQTIIQQPFKLETTDLGSGNTIHIVRDDLTSNPLCFLKEFIEMESPISGFVSEIVSQILLRAQNFENASLLSILGLGMYTTPYHVKKGLIMYNYIHSIPYEELYKTRTPIPALKIGHTFGEIGAVDSPLSIPDCYVKEKTTDLSVTSASVIFYLNKLGINSRLTAERVEMFTKDMNLNLNLDRAGLVHGDVHYNNMLIGKEITVIDTGTLMKSVNRIGMPHGMPVFDQQEIVVGMRILGAKYGYSPQEIESNVSEFLSGYSKYMPTISEPAVNFARLYYAAEELFKVVRKDRGLTENIMEWVNRDFGQPHVRSIRETPQLKKEPVPLLAVERLNRNFNNPLYFPPAFELEKSTLEILHEVWTRNQECLLGIIAEEKIPSFGLYGTTYLGMKNILNRKTSLSTDGDHLWVAGIPHKKQTFKQLGALYAIVEAASKDIGKNGGLFIIDTSTFKATEEGIFERIDILPLDSKQQINILTAMSSHADQLHVEFNSTNYSEKVKGLILDAETLYSEEIISALKNSEDYCDWGRLAHRLKIQETLITIFEKLGVVKDFHLAPWQNYHKVGTEILKR